MKRLAPVLGLTLVSCAVSPDYERPRLNLANEFVSASSITSPVTQSTNVIGPEEAWWRAFKDPVMNDLVNKAVAQNLPLQVARNRVREARALRQVSKASLLPAVVASGTGQRFSLSENAFGPLPALAQQGLADLDGELFDAGFDASWEIDLFGGNRSAIDSADAALEQLKQLERSALVSTIAEVARSYTELRSAQRRMAILEGNIRIQQDTLNLIENKLSAGLSSNLDVSRARAQLQSIQAQLPDFRIEVYRAYYQLAVLIGEQPGSEAMTELLQPSQLPVAPNFVPTGLPAELVWRRTDVLAAEQRLRGATADVGVANAALYPKFFLTGSLSQEGIRFTDLYEAASQAWTFGPLIQWPIFQGGALRANQAATEIRLQSAYADFQQTVLVALGDVESQLVAFAESRLKVNALRAAAQSSERSAELALILYERGLEDYLTVLDAQRTLAQQEDLLALGEAANVLTTIALYKALGGGWKVYEDQ